MRLIEMLSEFKEGDSYFVPSDVQYGDWDGIKFVEELELDERRWTMVMLTIVEFDGKLYGIEWERGLTENQEHEFYPGTRTVYEVNKVQKTTYDYVRKGQNV